MSTDEERRDQEKRKQEAPINIPQEAKEKKPKVTVPQPEQPKQTEEEQFMAYMNQLISNAVLDNDAIKSKTVDVLKSLGRQLGIYMREVARLNEEIERLKNPSKPPEKKEKSQK